MKTSLFRKKSVDELDREKPTYAQLRSRIRKPIYLLLEDIRSLYNVGALFRSADAALVEKIFLCGTTGRPPDTRIDKSALGACDVVPWEYCPSATSVVKDLKAKGITILVLEQTHTSLPYALAEYSFPLCLVLGNEVSGVSDELLLLADTAIEIPMQGRATSLNVATAGAIALFKILEHLRKV